MEIKRDWLGKIYTITAEDKIDEDALQKFNKYIDNLEEENKMLKKELGILDCKGGTPELVGHAEFIRYLIEENKKLKEENKKLKEELYIWKLTARDYARQQGINLPELSNI